MQWIRTADTLAPGEGSIVGGKAHQLARLQQMGFKTAPWLCVTTHAYDAYLDSTGLRERMALELHRKAFEEMRWEELWDCATRIRHMFLTTPMPQSLNTELEDAIDGIIGHQAAAVRSSAIDEDTQQASFAGLHESYVNIRGKDAIVRHVHLVWASLWSDAALLYRREIGLEVTRSAMAVLVQALVVGDSSGVTFTVAPTDREHAVIESVHGLNQGLVDGTIDPDRWFVQRDTGTIVSHTPAKRQYFMIPGQQDIHRARLPRELANKPPLDSNQVSVVIAEALKVETAFGNPQDVEWTMARDELTLLQSRPITTGPDKDDDQRGWYLSLHKSFDQLLELRRVIEDDHIPRMIETAMALGQVDLDGLSTKALGQEIRERYKINQHWSAVYWNDFIPYAHGVRLFGQYYNDRIDPDDPYEFLDLLTQTDMQSLERNAMLLDLAQMLRRDMDLSRHLSAALDQNPFEQMLKQFLNRFGDLSKGITGSRSTAEKTGPLLGLIKEMARTMADPPQSIPQRKPDQLKTDFLNHFADEERTHAETLLDLARSSYQLRDDDNIHLGRIEARFMEALDAAKRRLAQLKAPEEKTALTKIIAQVSPDANPVPSPADVQQGRYQFRQRQLVGQPAGPGLVKGPARVITGPDQLMAFKSGEILVCDAVDPNMTFVVPLAAAIVERRGGMLIHGAIIAREYGLACITGVPRATALIKTGDVITVDGYLGIVTLSTVGTSIQRDGAPAVE